MVGIDLFAGCGGLSLGLKDAGINVVLGVEKWEAARLVYEHNLKHECANLDLEDVNIAVEHIIKFRPDIIAGGPPCQDYSSAGKRKEGARADLTVSYGEIICSIRPRWALMENVPLARKSYSYNAYRQLLIDSGYGLTEVVLDASYYGVPQARKRFFSIGLLGAEDGFLIETIMSKKGSSQTTIREFFGDTLGLEHYYRHPRSYARRGVYSIDEPSATIRGVNRPIPGGYPGHPLDSSSDFSKIRPLTTKERALIQTFPREFELLGPKSAQEQMIGNAVPVNLGRVIGGCILEFEANNP